jgi:hypothetical protein
LGIDYFSLGSYIIPTKPTDPIRPPLKKQVDENLLRIAPDKMSIPASFVKEFDAVIVMHVPEWIYANWSNFKGKRIIWRTIGQSTPAIEATMYDYRKDGLEIVRYSKREANINNVCGSNKVIPFYKDPKEFNNWIGAGNEVITFAQNMKHRAEHCNYETFLKLADGFNSKIYGPQNDNSGPLNGGLLTYEQMRQKMRDARVYIYTGTQPASYTLNFIEALMTGIPVVAIGPKYANSLNIAGDTYEIPDIINNGINGFWSDDLDQLRENIKYLLSDLKTARRIGEMGRQTAIKIFDKERIKTLWGDYLYGNNNGSDFRT